jgi:hypothetical protein
MAAFAMTCDAYPCHCEERSDEAISCRHSRGTYEMGYECSLACHMMIVILSGSEEPVPSVHSGQALSLSEESNRPGGPARRGSSRWLPLAAQMDALLQ